MKIQGALKGKYLDLSPLFQRCIRGQELPFNLYKINKNLFAHAALL